MRIQQYWPLLWRATAVGALLLAEIFTRAALLGDRADHLDYFRLPQLLYSFVLIWAGALSILTAVEGSLAVRSAAARLAGVRPSAAWLVAHALSITPVVLPGIFAASGAPFALLQVIQHLLLAMAILALALALIPARLWLDLLGGGARRSLVALLLAGVAILAIRPAAEMWEVAAVVTFRLVRFMLAPFYPELQLVPESLLIVTDKVEIHIAKSCSGLEGVALILVMCSGWLWYLRRELRFPRALVLLPAAALFMFLLNSLRIALLSALAAEGHVGIATAGFHSQAGWIFFIGASFLVALLSRRIKWLHSESATATPAADPKADPLATTTAALLLPLVALLATGMLTSAMSAGFDALQWLRLPIATAVLLLYRDSYRSLDWRFGWRGIAGGILVFGIWLLAAQWLSVPAGMPQALAEQPPLQRAWWIATRALIAVLIVPIAEELAFRGFLMRRLKAADFTAVPLQGAGMMALLLSSLLFGFSHGSYWLPGIFAGLVFGALAIHTGRIGEAIAAHAVANGLLAVLVLCYGQWQHW